MADNNTSCYSCYSCSSCDSCDSCRSCYSCSAVINGLFCYKQEAKKNIIFRTQVAEERFNEVRNKYQSLLGEWSPRQTNGWQLYKESGESWLKIDMRKFKVIDWYDSWKEMPKEAIAYICSLPEFVAEDFKEITGLDATAVSDIVELTLEEVAKMKGVPVERLRIKE